MFILLVDNNRFYVSVLKEMLVRAGFDRIEYADNGLECFLQICKGDIPDVVIIDENQLYENGVDVLKNIRTSCPELTVIILTDTISLETAVQNSQRGSTYYITKESITTDNLPHVLYNIFTEKFNTVKHSSVHRTISSFRRTISSMLSF